MYYKNTNKLLLNWVYSFQDIFYIKMKIKTKIFLHIKSKHTCKINWTACKSLFKFIVFVDDLIKYFFAIK